MGAPEAVSIPPLSLVVIAIADWIVCPDEASCARAVGVRAMAVGACEASMG